MSPSTADVGGDLPPAVGGPAPAHALQAVDRFVRWWGVQPKAVRGVLRTWEPAETKAGRTVDIHPFAPLDRAAAELGAVEAERLGVYFGIPAVVSFGREDQGFHRAAHAEEPFIGRPHEREMPGMTLGFPNENDRPATTASHGAPDATIRSSLQ